MRKITLLLAFLFCISLSAQETISFESSEGYSLGNIHNQNGWTSTGFTNENDEPDNVDNQDVSNEQSTDGDWSFKITTLADFGPQDGPVIGGFYDYDTPIDYTDAVFSADIYIEEVEGGNDYWFAFTGDNTNEAGEAVTSIVTLFAFNFENNIRVVGDNEGTLVNVGSWETNTWYNVRIEITDNQAEYFVDDVSVATYDILASVDITSARFVHDNWGGEAFIDNFRTNDEPLSNDNFVAETNFTQFVNNDKLHIQASAEFNEIEVFDLSGKLLFNQDLNGASNAQVDIEALNQGIYIAKVNSARGSHSFKFAK